MSFPKYPKYKASGVEWLGDVPEHWKVVPFKSQLDRNDGGVWGDDPDGLNDTIVLRSTEQTVDGNWQLDDPAPRSLSKADIEGSLLVDGDLLLTKSSGSSLHIGKTTLVTPDIAAMRCCYSNFMQRIRTKPSFNAKLAWHVLNNELARRQFGLLSNSTTGLANLNGTIIGQIIVPVAPLPEQLTIAAFLDRETAKIDELVNAQARLIELLKEKRQAVISHAVTKGLNPHAPMKPSGVEWLGEVPEHWEVGRLKRVCHVFPSNVDKKSYDGETPVLLCNYTDVYYHDTIVAGTDFMAATATKAQIAQFTLRAGDTIITKDSETADDIAIAAYVPADLPGVICGYHLSMIRPTHAANGAFVKRLFDSTYVKSCVAVRANGLTRVGLGQYEIDNLDLPFPPLPEQLAIAAFLERETARIDTLTAEARRAITLLRERRSALISAAVTGQIDIRNTIPMEAA